MNAVSYSTTPVSAPVVTTWLLLIVINDQIYSKDNKHCKIQIYVRYMYNNQYCWNKLMYPVIELLKNYSNTSLIKMSKAYRSRIILSEQRPMSLDA